MQTIGQMIGKVSHKFSTKLDNGDKVELTRTYDFTNVPDADVKAWVLANRVINDQSGIRKLGTNEARALNGKTVDVSIKRARVARELTTEEVIAKARTMTPEQKARLVAAIEE